MWGQWRKWYNCLVPRCLKGKPCLCCKLPSICKKYLSLTTFHFHYFVDLKLIPDCYYFMYLIKLFCLFFQGWKMVQLYHTSMLQRYQMWNSSMDKKIPFWCQIRRIKDFCEKILKSKMAVSQEKYLGRLWSFDFSGNYPVPADKTCQIFGLGCWLSRLRCLHRLWSC